MAARQFQLDTETYANADDNGREFQIDAITYFIEEVVVVVPGGRIMSSLAYYGGLCGRGGIAGASGGLAG